MKDVNGKSLKVGDRVLIEKSGETAWKKLIDGKEGVITDISWQLLEVKTTMIRVGNKQYQFFPIDSNNPQVLRKLEKRRK